MDDLNSVCLVGRAAKDPELRTVGGNYNVCQLRLAFNTSQKNRDTGQWEDKGNFVDVKVWGTQAEAVSRYVSQGMRVAVKGRLEIREWESDNGRRYATEIVADRVQFIEPKSDSSSSRSTSTRTASRQASAPVPADDDIPF